MCTASQKALQIGSAPLESSQPGLRAEVLAPFLARALFLFMYFLQTSFAHRLWHLADLLPFLHFLASLHFFLSARSSHGGSEGDMGGGGGGCTQT